MPSSLTFNRARLLALGSAVVAVAATVLTMLSRGADPIEVAATIFFIGVMAGALVAGWKGGLLLAAAAFLIYLVMRLPALRLVGWGVMGTQIMSRLAGYVAFGAVAGWAASRVRASLDKLELYDDVDDDTGLLNARGIVQAIDAEQARSERYQKVFSVVVCEVSSAETMGSVRELGKRLGAAIRTTDRAGHVREGSAHLFAFILTETSAEGAKTFRANLDRNVTALSGPQRMTFSQATVPGDEAAVEAMVERFRTADKVARGS